MRDRTEYLLACLGEECGELQQEAAKCIRFGIYNRHPVTEERNVEKLRREYHDVVAVYRLLFEILGCPAALDEEKIQTKQSKVNMYFDDKYYLE